jgi:glycerol-3-phosphate acyltransferase PlsY
VDISGSPGFTVLFWLVAGYLLGSFPSAYLTGRLFSGRDIRKVGSGNVGGMNTLRNIGPAAGILTGICDAGKGALAVWAALHFGPAGAAGGVELVGPAGWAPLAAMVGAVTGHNWMLFLGFKGGKGLGTTFGALLVLAPLLALAFLGLIGLGALITRDSNVGAGLAALAQPVALGWGGGWDPAWIIAGAGLALVIALKHRPDFAAYRAGRRRMT